MAEARDYGIATKAFSLEYLKALYAKSAIFLMRHDKGQSIWQKPAQPTDSAGCYSYAINE